MNESYDCRLIILSILIAGNSVGSPRTRRKSSSGRRSHRHGVMEGSSGSPSNSPHRRRKHRGHSEDAIVISNGHAEEVEEEDQSRMPDNLDIEDETLMGRSPPSLSAVPSIECGVRSAASPSVAAPNVVAPNINANANVDVNIQDVIFGYIPLNNCISDVNIKNNDGGTPLKTAAWRGHSDIAQLLIKAGAKE